jgi:hypothetical protein
VRALSLWADAAFLLRMMGLASAEPDLIRYVRALISLRTVGVCWRAAQSGLDTRWLTAFFFRGPFAAPPPAELAAAVKAPSPLRLIQILGPADFSPSGEDFRESLGKGMDDYLTRIAGRGRHDTYGVTRVLHYVRQAWIEHFNLRLCVAAVLTPLPLRQTQGRLRRD